MYSFVINAFVGPDNFINSKEAFGNSSASEVIRFIGDYGLLEF